MGAARICPLQESVEAWGSQGGRCLGLLCWGDAALAAQHGGAGVRSGRCCQHCKPLSVMPQLSHHGAPLCQVTRWAPSSASSAASLIPLGCRCSPWHSFARTVDLLAQCCPPCQLTGRRLRWVWGSVENPWAHVSAIQISTVNPTPAADGRQR